MRKSFLFLPFREGEREGGPVEIEEAGVKGSGRRKDVDCHNSRDMFICRNRKETYSITEMADCQRDLQVGT